MTGHEVVARFDLKCTGMARIITSEALDLALTIAGNVEDEEKQEKALSHLEKAVEIAIGEASQ